MNVACPCSPPCRFHCPSLALCMYKLLIDSIFWLTLSWYIFFLPIEQAPPSCFLPFDSGALHFDLLSAAITDFFVSSFYILWFVFPCHQRQYGLRLQDSRAWAVVVSTPRQKLFHLNDLSVVGGLYSLICSNCNKLFQMHCHSCVWCMKSVWVMLLFHLFCTRDTKHH